jgi:hypothetical protein
LPPLVGQFSGNRGEFYGKEDYNGRAIRVPYGWLNISPTSSRMEQVAAAKSHRDARGVRCQKPEKTVTQGFRVIRS